MSDANKFVNAYIDFAVGQLHENVNTILQLKAQHKLANDLVAERDLVISQLQNDLESIKVDNQEIVKQRDQARKWEEAYNAVSGKVAHLDTALGQIASMKQEIIKRDEIIANLEAQLEALKNPPSKKSINSKVKKEAAKVVETKVDEPAPAPVVEPVVITPKPTDDF